MNREFIGKKRFYLEGNPTIYSDVRIYVVETKQSEYKVAVLESGDAFEIQSGSFGTEEFSDVEAFQDFNGRNFIEFSTETKTDVTFFDKKGYKVGRGEFLRLKTGSKYHYLGRFMSTRSFKYKPNGDGWKYTIEAGSEITAEFESANSIEISLEDCMNMLGLIFGPKTRTIKDDDKSFFYNHYYQLTAILPKEYKEE